MAEPSQFELWNHAVGDAWVDHADAFDLTLAPFGEAVMERLAPQAGERVLDIGCGTGATTRLLASIVAPGAVLGVDLSATMLDEATRRAAAVGLSNVEYLAADVQDEWFDHEPFDVAFSRFGVMFFPDPVLAFSNIAAALRPGGRLGFICFQSPAVNPFMVVPVFAGAAQLDGAIAPTPGAPGPFSLADPEHVESLLHSAGFESVTIDAGPDQAVLVGADDLDALAARLLAQNPMTATALAQAEPSTRGRAVRAAAAALEEHRGGDVVRMGAGTWVVTATAAG